MQNCSDGDQPYRQHTGIENRSQSKLTLAMHLISRCRSVQLSSDKTKWGKLCHLFHLRFTLIKILKIENYKSLLNPMSWSQEISKISKDLCFSVETSNESECPVLLCRKHDLFNDRLLHRFKFVKKITTFHGIC